jgi:hypothetical protein
MSVHSTRFLPRRHQIRPARWVVACSLNAAARAKTRGFGLAGAAGIFLTRISV